MSSTTLAQPRLRVSRQSGFSQWSGSDHYLQMPQAGPSRISPQMNASDVHYDDDDDSQATPRVALRSQLDSFADPTPSTSTLEGTSGVARLRAIMAKAKGQGGEQSTSRPSPPLRRQDSFSDMESDFGTPHVTAGQSLHAQSLRELFSKASADLTPRFRKLSGRRNSIDLSEVEDSPRVERVKEERAMHKGKRRSASDEETDMYTKSTEGSEISRHTSSAAKYGALQDRLDSSLRTPRAPQDPTRTTAFSIGQGVSGAEDLMGLEPPTDMDASETSGDTAKLLRHLDHDPAASTPVATSTPFRSLQLPSHFNSQSNLLDQNSTMENAMKGLESEEESGVSQRRLPFPPSRPNGREPSPDPTSRAHGKSHTAHGIPLPRRVSSGGRESVSSRSSSLSATDFHDRLRDDHQEKLHERERQWKPSGKSPALARTPETARRVSQGSPSNSGMFTANGGSPSQRMLGRRSSSASMHGPRDGRVSMTSSISSQADYKERMADMEYDKAKERERMWNKPQPRRSSSSLSFNSSGGERSRPSSTSSRPESAQGYNRIDGRPTSWHSPNGSTQNFRLVSPGKDGIVVQERERNWNSPHPKWEFQIPRAMSPLPPSPPVAGSGYGKPPPDWDPNKDYESPSRSRHTSLTNVVGRRASYERSRTSSHTGELRPSPSHGSLRRAGTDPKQERGHSPALSEAGDEDRAKEGASRFGWTFPKRRANLPPFEADVDSPQRRPSTPESRPSSRLSTHGSLIPVRSPARKGETSASPRAQTEDDGEQKKGHRRSSATFTESMGPVVSRSRIEPVDLMDVNIEDLAPTDIESGSDAESHVTSTPIAVPTTLPASSDPEPGPGPSTLSQAVTSSDDFDASEYPDTFVTAASPDLSPVREDPPEPIFGLSTPPRRPLLTTPKLEFQTPSPPRNMPELPPPPSLSSEDDDDMVTPVNVRVSLLADFTAAKTPRPPGAWAATPAPAEKAVEDKPAPVEPPLPPEAETPEPASAPANTTANSTLSGIPTPAPPGAWQLTPRRKSILKVRFDVDPNTSGESMPEVPMISPADPADSISEVFPALMPPGASMSKAPLLPEARTASSPVEAERPGTPPTVKPPRTRPKSPGLRVVDPYGREAPPEEPTPPTTSSVKDGVEAIVPAAKPPIPSPGNKSLVRIVDAMGREVEEEQSMSESSASLPPPTNRSEALSRMRQTLSKMADDLGESDDSRPVATREDQRLQELYKASQAARTARRDIAESLQKQRGADPSSLIKVGAKGKLLAPAIRSSRFSIDFLNTWVLFCFLLLQIVLFVYMYRLSTLRAKQIFLTTYYDAFSPDLFSHLSKTQAVQHAIPPASSPTPSPFSITDALTRDGWKAVLAEAWARTTVVVAEWQNHVWDAWGQHPGRTQVWPPT